MAGVPLGEVARRLGHSVETLVTTYAGVLAGDEALAIKRIDDVLSTTGAPRADGLAGLRRYGDQTGVCCS